MEVFEAMGITGYGILLSDRDATAHPNARAPETRTMRDRKAVHRVADYTGTDGAEREARIAEIVGIAGEHGYNAVFAGYGFMAEDEALVEALEAAGLNFIGPGSATVRAAGRKDAAKRTALTQSISVTPGVDNVTSLALLAKCGERAGLEGLARENGLTPPDDESDGETAADALLSEATRRGIELVTRRRGARRGPPAGPRPAGTLPRPAPAPEGGWAGAGARDSACCARRPTTRPTAWMRAPRRGGGRRGRGGAGSLGGAGRPRP